MKRVLILTMLAAMALTLPVGAMAPIIEDLPSVIIGDADDVLGGTGPVRLMRYVNVVNLASPTYINRLNANDISKLHVWYTTSGDVVKASDESAIIDPLTVGELAQLQAGNDALAAKEITDGGAGFYWLSLINDAINQVATTPATDAYSATAAANGVDQSNYPAGSVGAANAQVLTLYAADGDLPTTLISLPGSMMVYSMADVDDSYSPAEVIVPEATGTDDTFFGEWIHRPYEDANVGVATTTSVSGGVGWALPGANGTKPVLFGSWRLAQGGTQEITPIPAQQSIVGSMIYRATVTVTHSGVATSCPDFRLLYYAEGFTHLGGFLSQTGLAANDAADTAASGADLDISAYWAVPYDLSEYADGEFLSDISGSAVTLVGPDVRNYGLMFDVVDMGTEDVGTFALQAVDVARIQRPAAVTPTLDWPGTTAFNAAGNGFGAGVTPPTSFNLGSLDVSGGTTMILGPGATYPGWQQAFPDPAQATVGVGSITSVADSLIRVTVDLSVGTVNAAPSVRMLTATTADDGTGAFQGLLWVDVFSDTLMIETGMVPADGAAPGVPNTSSTTVESYCMTHNAGVTNSSVIVPGIDCYNIVNDAAWPAATSNLTITSVTVEEL